ncbi:MAG: hypothetical protein HYS27_26530 [Deltaproteobacteria bacterium]|nr:hypothetical protein [Deltaproteobacteria bacterium]
MMKLHDVLARWCVIGGVLAALAGTLAGAGCLVPIGPTTDQDDDDNDDDNDDDDNNDNDNNDNDNNDNDNDNNDNDNNDNDNNDNDNNNNDDDDTNSDDTGQYCESNDDCQEICIFEVDDPGAGICSKRCESFADCPSFWDCSDIGAAAGTYCTP